MFEFSVGKGIIREVAIGKVVTCLCLILIIKKLKMNVEQGRMVTTYRNNNNTDIIQH